MDSTRRGKLDVPTAEARARALLEKRMVSIRELASSHETVTDLRAQVAEAEAAAAKAFRAALTDGWAPEELRGLGFEEPSKPRRRSRRTRATKAADDVSQEEQAPSEQA